VKQSGPGQAAITYEGPTINGIPMPGQWLVTKLTKDFGVQVQQANFKSGATLLLSGDPPLEVEYTVNIWQSGAMGVFRGLLQTVLKRPAIALSGPVPASAVLGINDPC
jgi:hypothetical protein